MEYILEDLRTQELELLRLRLGLLPMLWRRELQFRGWWRLERDLLLEMLLELIS